MLISSKADIPTVIEKGIEIYRDSFYLINDHYIFTFYVYRKRIYLLREIYTLHDGRFEFMYYFKGIKLEVSKCLR